MIWDALVACLCAIAAHVSLRDEQFEELLDMLDPVLDSPEVRTKLESAGADTVWLRLYKREREGGAKQAERNNVPGLKGRLGRKFALVAV